MSVFRKERVTCQRCVEVFPDLVDGKPEGPLHARVRRRLERVPFCRRCFASYRRAVAACRGAMRRPVAPAVGERLMEFLRSRTGQS